MASDKSKKIAPPATKTKENSSEDASKAQSKPKSKLSSQILDVLVKQDYITKEDLEKAKANKKKTGASIQSFLISQGILTNDLMGQAMAEFYNVPYADLNSNVPSKEQVLTIGESVAKAYNAILYRENEKEVVVATVDPKKKGIELALKKVFPKRKIILAYALKEDIDVNFTYYRKALKTRFAEILEKERRVAPELVDEIFKDALSFKASDIHFEPTEKEVLVRFRIDGILSLAGRFPKPFYENILNRIKVLARMKIDEHFSAQDGAIRYKNEFGVVDMRVSILPTINGEKIVIRLLAQYLQSISLSDLGLSASHKKMLEEAAKKPFGMILVTGPTGSGKSTTLYAVLRSINKPEINITTIEDPVEYHLDGINQIQVNNKTELTFSKGLRSIVRQDPDVILVGEIRDQETAEISVNAALTGHLLLSTFHSNDSATSIPRLLDMGVEPFLLASTFELVMAQRLVRKICEGCRHSVNVSIEDIQKEFPKADKYFKEKNITLYKGKGCINCGHTGYKGRQAIFEIIQMTPQMQDLILKNPSSQEIWALARKTGTESLFEDGVEKVKKGITTMEELLRVAQPPKELAELEQQIKEIKVANETKK